MNQTVKTILIRSLILGGCVLVIGLGFNRLSPRGLPLIARHQSVIVQGRLLDIPLFVSRRAVAQSADLIKKHPAEEIDLERVRQLFAGGTAIFLDAREYADYLTGHIEGAVSVPYTEFQDNPESVEQLDRAACIVTYCDGNECQTSIDLAVRLNEMGFTDVWFYFGGWNEWSAAGLPIVKGGRP
jgi:rhodanese-related sulfurtransferase